MMIVPGTSLPSKTTSSRGIGEAVGCNGESSALAQTYGALLAKNRQRRAAERIVDRTIRIPFLQYRRQRPKSGQTSTRRRASISNYGEIAAPRNPPHGMGDPESTDGVKLSCPARVSATWN